jgi:hypothetical protein
MYIQLFGLLHSKISSQTEDTTSMGHVKIVKGSN